MERGTLIRVEWLDIQSDSSWVEHDTLKPAHCVSVGFFDCKQDGFLRMYASYNEHETGDRTAIPLGVITSIEKINENRKSSRK